jgi:pimeloyl-ACP methyl ester carboxylesterase
MSTTTTALQATSDFYASNPVTRVLRLALGTSQRLWPALGLRLAYRLFGTPLPPRWLRRDRPWPGHWTQERWAFEDASLTLHHPLRQPAASASSAPAEGACVLLVHGWGGHAGQMLPLAQALIVQGLRPVLLDLPAHGKNGGRVSSLPQFARAIEYTLARLAQQGHTVQGVVAHSLAANGLAFAAARGLPTERLVLMAPPASPREYTRLFAQVFGLHEPMRAALQRHIEAREGIVMTQFDPDASGPRITQPTLVVHDRGDRINPFVDGTAFAEAIPGARLLATDGLGHTRLLRDALVTQAVVSFLA